MKWHDAGGSIRKLIAVLFLLALAGGCASPVPVTVVTYNIHHGVGNDGKLDLERIAAVLRDAKPDFVALQEVDLATKRTSGVDQAKELARLTGMNFVYGAAMDYDGGKYGDAVLSKCKIEWWRVVPLPWQPGGKREPRCAIITGYTLPNQRELAFITTHLDHTGEPSDRYLQAKAINDAASNLKTAILAGDFNCEVGSPPMQELTGQELGGKWTLVSDADPTLTCPSDTPKEKIDHVFVRPKERWKVTEVKVIDDRIASDHRPVMVKMELLPGE
jgi:endonuclease/exonuclease/phosphatase family metal-dependent hydrolase